MSWKPGKRKSCNPDGDVVIQWANSFIIKSQLISPLAAEGLKIGKRGNTRTIAWFMLFQSPGLIAQVVMDSIHQKIILYGILVSEEIWTSSQRIG